MRKTESGPWHGPGFLFFRRDMIGVYFIQAKASQLIKIGATSDLHLRMKSLMGANADDLKVIGFIPAQDLISAKRQESILRGSQEKAHDL